MKVYCIKNEKGQLISAWPKLGVAKIHCRTELKDYIRVGSLSDFRKPKPAKPAKKTFFSDRDVFVGRANAKSAKGKRSEEWGASIWSGTRLTVPFKSPKRKRGAK